MTSTASIWETLVRNKREIVTTAELALLATRLGRLPAHAIRHLRRSGYLAPLFKGYYYVRTAEELRLGDPRYNSLELFALAAKVKDLGSWYFGLHTALRLNGMTHEDRREETVISDSFYRIHGVPIADRRFIIHKWRSELATFGLVHMGGYRHSDPEKTVLDFAYLDLHRERKHRAATRTWEEHLASVDPRRLRSHLRHYPEGVVRSVGGRL